MEKVGGGQRAESAMVGVECEKVACVGSFRVRCDVAQTLKQVRECVCVVKLYPRISKACSEPWLSEDVPAVNGFVPTRRLSVTARASRD